MLQIIFYFFIIFVIVAQNNNFTRNLSIIKIILILKENAMGNDNSRRDFISKVAVGTIAVATPSFAKNNTKTKEERNMSKKVILAHRPLGFQWEPQNPFLFCVHHEDFLPAGNSEMAPDPSLLLGRQIGSDFVVKDGFRMYHGDKIPGFPAHPHRGFETVTVVRRGMVDHADSKGASGRYGGGDVQWMTAGSGLQHSEMFPLLNSKKENTLELFQIWLNLPSKSKMVEPDYKMLWSEDIPNADFKDNSGYRTNVTIIAGELAGGKPPSPPRNSWAADPENDVAIWNIRMEANAKWKVPPASKDLSRSFYFFKGESLIASGENVDSYHAIDVVSDEEILLENGNSESFILMLQGKPIDEPVVKYGPFVMNTKEEIQQAFIDYQKDNFGGWPWKDSGQVHPREKGRFAIHFDGKEEIKS
jgi:quercetin 2,3-dioxygenase